MRVAIIGIQGSGKGTQAKLIAKKFKLREKLLEKELDKFLSLNQQKEDISIQRTKRIKVSDPSIITGDNSDIATANQIEKDIIELLLEGNREIIELIFDHIHPDEIKNVKFRKVMEIVEDCYNNGNTSPSEIIEKVTDDETKTFILSIALNQDAISKKWDEHYESGKVEMNPLPKTIDVVKKFRIARINDMIKENNRYIATHDDDEKIIELMKENKEMEIQKKLILEGKGNSDLI